MKNDTLISKKSKSSTQLLQDCPSSVSPETRRVMIADAAYFLAERRGFEGDESCACADWLEAERIIDQQLSSQTVNPPTLKQPVVKQQTEDVM